MKKAISLALALVLCFALAVPAFATFGPGNSLATYDGRNPTLDAALLQQITQRADMGAVGWLDSDVSFIISPAMANTVPAAYYWVQPGDDLEGIAFTYYGQPSLATALYNANKEGHFLASGGFLAAGWPIRLPDNLNGHARLASPILTAPASTSTNGVWSFTRDGAGNGNIVDVPGVGIVYQVRSGDTLAKIVSTFYNGRTDSFIINRIVATNINLQNANSLTVGQYIILPSINIGF